MVLKFAKARNAIQARSARQQGPISSPDLAFIWPSPGGRSQRLCALLPARRWKAGVKKDYNFALCRFVVFSAPRSVPEITLLLCTASVSQYSFQARFDWAGSQTGFSQTNESNHDDMEQRILCCAGDCLIG